MKVESKYNVGDKGYFMCGRIPTSAIIKGIIFNVGVFYDSNGCGFEIKEGTYTVEYSFENNRKLVSEKDIYPSASELKEALFDKLE